MLTNSELIDKAISKIDGVNSDKDLILYIAQNQGKVLCRQSIDQFRDKDTTVNLPNLLLRVLVSEQAKE